MCRFGRNTLLHPISRPALVHEQALQTLASLCESGKQLFVLTGAGCSTRSGIPDYRDDNGEWKHAKPIMYDAFMSAHAVRQRYWARSMLGWPRMVQAQPSDTHHAITALQRAGHIHRLVTQNVDGLHQAAGSQDVIDLHGRLDEVRCQHCAQLFARADWQARITELNPHWQAQVNRVQAAPDGDMILENADYGAFEVPACPLCTGIVKPEVVFFGENVPRESVEQAYSSVDKSDATLVIGSSLMVFSGFRFARRCHELGKPLFIINRGTTRADALAQHRINLDCADALGQLLTRLSLTAS